MIYDAVQKLIDYALKNELITADYQKSAYGSFKTE